ncbi:store-operated calcium entry-associated regulatory factor [Protopterus annectens]|uniref:store-operated calcium entry-associated regulatory factor n=1 Tax=Protopterus annectens TaxID=7888 RepID=UPI001CFBD1D3|nr:store-operated calcium entry-associated regulatory factor [Protopterus annectens]
MKRCGLMTHLETCVETKYGSESELIRVDTKSVSFSKLDSCYVFKKTIFTLVQAVTMERNVGLLSAFLLLSLSTVQGWNNEDKVLLKDIQAITLHRNRYTNARRASPIPQLQCTGGSAGCSAFVPEVVQCQSRGWDGFDIQWECKTDMDTSYRFGTVSVSCEGFDYPDDPYVLRGSCGLEYTLELTEAGRKRHGSSFGNGIFGSGFSAGKGSSEFNGVVVLVIFLVLAYGVYKMFLCRPQHPNQPYADGTDSSYGFSGQNTFGPSPPGFMGPPPPGFNPDVTGSSAGSTSSSGGFGFGNVFNQQRPTGSSGPGFWSGFGTGGALGYLFGNQNAQRSNSPFGNWGSTGNSSSMFGSTSTSNTKPPESSTRTASGFGGTKRR